MLATRFYEPKELKLTAKELLFAEQNSTKRLANRPRVSYPEEAEFNFFAPFKSRVVMHDANSGKSAERWPYQIMYNFPPEIRSNVFPVMGKTGKVMARYGASGWSYRMLYEFLCDMYNGGFPFVDTYFQRVFKTRTVYGRFLEIYDTIQENIAGEQEDMNVPLKADNTPDMRFTVSKKFMDFKVWRDPIIRQNCEDLGKAIRDDIVLCLRTGNIPLERGQRVSEKTKQMRERFGWTENPDQLFYASGRLIKHLRIYVRIGEKGAQAA